MAYEKQTWECGETISADKLNHMEDGIANSGGDAGYECTETRTTLTEENVTTSKPQVGDIEGALSYSDPISADTIIAIFDGVEYVLDVATEEVPGGVEYSYGGAGYPFRLRSASEGAMIIGNRNMLYTATEGTYSIKIEISSEAVETTPCFEKAVKSVAPELSVVQLINGATTKAEIAEAYADGKLMYCIDNKGHYHIVEYPVLDSSLAFSVFPTDAGLLFGLDNTLQYFAVAEISD